MSTGAAGLDPGVTDPAIADLLDRICPYLLSEDGTYRSSEPDPDHRCMAQDPPGTLPLAFPERYCLSERHVRCEMYKYAQSAREAALDQEGIPAAKVRSARFRPSVRSVPVALGPSSGSTAGGGTARRRPTGALVAGSLVAGVVLLVLLAFLLDGLAGPDASPDPNGSAGAATQVPASTPTPTPPATQAAETLAPEPSAAVAPADVVLIQYVVQEGERLNRIAETFGIRPRQIIDANDGMAEADPPLVETGDVIVVPVPASMSTDEIEELPGFDGYVE